MTVTVLLADDQALVRAGFRALLRRADVTVVGEAGTGEEAVRAAKASSATAGASQVVKSLPCPHVDGASSRATVSAPTDCDPPPTAISGSCVSPAWTS